MATNGAQDVHAFAFNDALTDPMLASVRWQRTAFHAVGGRRRIAGSAARLLTARSIALSDLSPDNRTVATAGRSGPIHLWDLETGEERVIDADRQFLTDLAFSPDGSTLAYTGFTEGGLDGNYIANTRGGIALLDAETGEPVGQLDNSTRYFVRMAFSPDGETLAAYESNDANVQTWNWREDEDLAQGAPLFDVPEGIEALQYTPDGALIAAIGWDHVLRFYDADSGEQRVELAERFFKPSVAIAFSPDGSRLAVGEKFTDTISNIVVYDFETGAEMTRLLYQTSTNVVNGLTFSPDGTLIAAITDENRLHVWDAATGDLLFDEQESFVPNNRLHVSSDGRMIVTADWGGLIRVWAIPG
ncbi:MAG: WD40 repeat domain-containing protein [Chloroflexi bacterium]|nr:WD40 repeat domain-containing protein [Chloroflexota bacterium]